MAVGGVFPLEPGGWSPPARLPAQQALSYWKEAITLVLLVLALPWLAWKLVTRPEDVFQGAARKHVGVPAP